MQEVWLNKENVTEVYREVGRIELKTINTTLIELLEKVSFKKGWLELYRKDMIQYLRIRHKPNNLFPYEYGKDILRVLKVIDVEKQALKRVLSIKCFGDSKYFEKKIEHIIIRIIKKYLLNGDVQNEESNDDILLEVRNFEISRNNRILWRFRV